MDKKSQENFKNSENAMKTRFKKGVGCVMRAFCVSGVLEWGGA